MYVIKFATKEVFGKRTGKVITEIHKETFNTFEEAELHTYRKCSDLVKTFNALRIPSLMIMCNDIIVPNIEPIHDFEVYVWNRKACEYEIVMSADILERR